MVYSTKIRFDEDIVITITLDPENETFAGTLQVGDTVAPIEIGGE